MSIPVLASGEMEVHDPWIREAPPTVKVLAGYFTLHNHSDKTHAIISVSSPKFESVEIHRTEIKNGMTRMHPVSKVMISSHGKVLFEPGGLHLMLINPKNKIKSGDKAQLTLHLADGSTFNFTVPVRKKEGMEDHSNHGTMHH